MCYLWHLVSPPPPSFIKLFLKNVQDAFRFVWPGNSAQETITQQIRRRRTDPPKPVSRAIRHSLRKNSECFQEQIDGSLDTRRQPTMTKAELLHHAWVSGQVTSNKYVEILKTGIDNSPEGMAILQSLITKSRPLPPPPNAYAPVRQHPKDHAYARRYPPPTGGSMGGGWKCHFCNYTNQPTGGAWVCAMCGRMRDTIDDASSVGSSHSDMSYLTEYSGSGFPSIQVRYFGQSVCCQIGLLQKCICDFGKTKNGSLMLTLRGYFGVEGAAGTFESQRKDIEKMSGGPRGLSMSLITGLAVGPSLNCLHTRMLLTADD